MSRSTCLILAGLAVILAAQSAAGCSIALGPKERLAGEATVLDVPSGKETTFQFEGIGIGADCSATNRMQVSGSQMALAVDWDVEVRDLEGRPVGVVDLGDPDRAWLSERFFRLDGGSVYFPDEATGKVIRAELPSGGKRDVVEIPTDQLNGFTVQDGLISWISGADGLRLTVYDQTSGTFVNKDRPVLGSVFDPYLHSAELLGIDSGRAYVLVFKGYGDSNAREVHAVDLFSYESHLAANLSERYSLWTAFHRGELVVWDYQGIVILDLSTNSTRPVAVSVGGYNLDYDGTTMVFNRWIVLREPPLIPTSGPGLLVLAAVSAAAVAGILIPASTWIVRRRRREKREASPEAPAPVATDGKGAQANAGRIPRAHPDDHTRKS